MIENTISIDCTEALETADINAEYETKVQNENISATEAETENDKMSEEAQADGAEKTEDSSADQQEDTVELKLYGETVRVPLSQAVVQAQKGMAFEFLKAQLADARNDARLKTLEAVAQHSGKTLSHLVLDIHSNAVTERLIAQYGSIEDVPYEACAQAVEEIENCRRQLEHSENDRRKNHWRSQLMEFVETNPGVREIPDEVIKAAAKGDKLSDAYSRFYGNKIKQELDEARHEIDILKSRSTAAQRSTPSAAAVGGVSPKENEFLKIMKSTW